MDWNACKLGSTTAICLFFPVNRGHLSGSRSSDSVPAISHQGLLPGHFKKSVWWENITWKQKAEIIITTALIPLTDRVVHVALLRKPSQSQPQQQTDAWHRGEGPIQVTVLHAPKRILSWSSCVTRLDTTVLVEMGKKAAHYLAGYCSISTQPLRSTLWFSPPVAQLLSEWWLIASLGGRRWRERRGATSAISPTAIPLL